MEETNGSSMLLSCFCTHSEYGVIQTALAASLGSPSSDNIFPHILSKKPLLTTNNLLYGTFPWKKKMEMEVQKVHIMQLNVYSAPALSVILVDKPEIYFSIHCIYPRPHLLT